MELCEDGALGAHDGVVFVGDDGGGKCVTGEGEGRRRVVRGGVYIYAWI